MNARANNLSRLAAALGMVCLLVSLLPAATPTPPPPLPKSPVESFRELLTMTLDERKQAIANRPPDAQKQILAKVREYLALKAEDRESRLRATELRWYLFPMLNVPATNRTAQIAFVPPDLQPIVEDRLAQWDSLTPATQKELLDNELTSRYFAQFESSTPEQRTNLLAGISSHRRVQLEAGMARWSTLSEAERRGICERFDRFFELTPREKEKALKTLSETERQQMEKTLRLFEKLPKPQREMCVRAFEKFAGLSLEDRVQFFKNAERWVLMSQDERQAWRDLVAKVPTMPPPPPAPPPPMPPRPPGPVATNASQERHAGTP